MRICIFGVGAVGGYFGGRLAQVNPDVTFIARGKTLEALQKDGLRVYSINGDFYVQPVRVTSEPKQVGPVDFVLMATKAWQVPELAESLKPLMGEKTGVIFLGNGVEAQDQLAARLGKEHVLGGLCRISAFVAQPGVIHHVGLVPTAVIGELDNRLSSRLEGLKGEFEKAGVGIEIPEDILTAIWQKFIFIATISGMGALTRSPIGPIRSIPQTRSLLESTIEEIVQVGRAKGVHLPEDQSAKTMGSIDGLDPSGLASMQRDIMARRPSELENQNGAVVRMGKQYGVSTPVNQFIYSCLIPQELVARGQLDI